MAYKFQLGRFKLADNAILDMSGTGVDVELPDLSVDSADLASGVDASKVRDTPGNPTLQYNAITAIPANTEKLYFRYNGDKYRATVVTGDVNTVRPLGWTKASGVRGQGAIFTVNLYLFDNQSAGNSAHASVDAFYIASTQIIKSDEALKDALYDAGADTLKITGQLGTTVFQDGDGDDATSLASAGLVPAPSGASNKFLKQQNGGLTFRTDVDMRSDLGLGSSAVRDMVDEDNMNSNSDIKVPSQQSVKAYVDAQAANAATVTVADTTDTTCFVGLWESATGDIGAKSDAGLTYNAGTGMLTATGLTGPLTGTASLATLASTITVADDESGSGVQTILFGGPDGGGSVAAKSDGTLTYQPSTGKVTATGFIGDLTGNASGTAATVTTAAQGAITSLGTLTTLTVDNVTINANAISSNHASSMTLTATSGQAVAVEGVSFDGGVVTGASSITSTAFVGALTGAASLAVVADSNANTNFPVIFHDESNALLDDTGALRYNPSTGTLLVPNLTVAGTTTQVNTVTMNAANAVIFEGATADDFESTLTIVDPTADRTIRLPNQSGWLPVLAAASAVAITATPGELNLLDTAVANTVVNSKAVIYGGSGQIAGTLSTAAQGNITSLGTLTALTVDNLGINGNTITSNSGHVNVNSAGNIEMVVDSAQGGGNYFFKVSDGGDANMFKLSEVGGFEISVSGVGKDFIVHGATGGTKLQWDASADDLILNGAAGLIVPEGKITLGSTAITATAAELNVLDGAVTAGANGKAVLYTNSQEIQYKTSRTLTQALSGGSATATLNRTLGQVVILSTSGGNRVLKLPAMSTISNGLRIVFKRKGTDPDSETMTVQKADGDGPVIEGADSLLLEPGASITLIADENGNNWFII